MIRFLTAAGLATLTLAAPAAAQEARLYPYPVTANYCPAGLQPVVYGGVISCGVPNQAETYADVTRHPAPRRGYYYAPPRRVDPTLYGSKSPGGY